MKKSGLAIFIFFCSLSFLAAAQEKNATDSLSNDHQFELGLLFQKSYHFYWENGLTFTYRSATIVNSNLGIGLNLLSSRLGSALGSNAIKQDQVLVYGQYTFMSNKLIRPFVQLNIGYLKAHYNDTYFQLLEDQSLLTSINIGATGILKDNFIIKGSLGYNLIGGDGTSGVGTIYPLIFHLSAQYLLKK